jgi:type IV pilus assembly protein PilQ
VKQFHTNGLIAGTSAVLLLAAQPVSAQITEITEVKLTPANGGISLVLNTANGSRPQIFTTKRGKSLVADIINTQLRIPQGKNFRQENPVSGIVSVEVNQLDANSVRLIVTGSNDAPQSQPLMRKDNNITFGFTPSTNTVASAPPSSPQDTTSANPTANTGNTAQKPDVLVPNPQVTIDGKPAQPSGPGQTYNVAPPFLPRAVAPPVGDISVANIDASPSVIDLGTQERVPRLVLRDAPVREVLSLLARAAGMNVAFVGGEEEDQKTQSSAEKGDQQIYQKISLDIENEPVQDVFNYVLRLSGLEANRSGRTIFVGPKLPNSTRDIVMRNLRLNQVTVGVALNFLVALGAESAVSRERLVTSVNAVPVGGASTTAVTQTQTTTERKIETQRVDYKDSTPILRGLQASGDERTNSVTLVGTPKQVEMAVAQLTQLDIRRRQVVVNVKIIDVNLSGVQDYNTSFSFGVGNNYFAVDGGAATFNFGGSRPATGTEVSNSVTETPVTVNPLGSANVFLNPSNPSGPSGVAGVNSDPRTAGITQFTPGTPGTTTTQIVPTAINPITGEPTGYGFQTTTTAGTPDRYTLELPTLFQFPKRFLASLQAQVTSGNAKILTDPTLIVQEGQQAVVNLTEQVVGNIKNEITSSNSLTTQTFTVEKEQVGLTLGVKIERIDDNGFVSLSVSPSVKAPQATQQVNLINNSTQTIFLVSERSLQSGLIRLRDGQTLILSGIIQDRDRTTVTKLPILGDLPLIGSLFRQTNRTNERKEVIVLLTPQIMDDSERSSYGYNYTPSPQVREILERRGVRTPNNR